MNTYNITHQQKHLLQTIIKYLENGFIDEPIKILHSFDDYQIIGIREKFDHSLLGNLDALCDTELMGFTYDNQGKKMYIVKQAGYDAVKNDFAKPETPPSQQIIGAYINEMQGGNIQAIALSDHSQVKQIVNDPQQLAKQMDQLGNQLIDAVKSELAADHLVKYIRLVEDLKKEISAERPSPSVIQRGFSSLAFIGDVEGAVSFALRVWPYIQPMLALAAEKIMSVH
jgi:hypothetical protein